MSGVWGSSLKFAFPSTNVLKKSTSTFNNSMQCGSAPSRENFREPGAPQAF